MGSFFRGVCFEWKVDYEIGEEGVGCGFDEEMDGKLVKEIIDWEEEYGNVDYIS